MTFNFFVKYYFLTFFKLIASPVLYAITLYERFIKRLSGVVESTPEERHEEKHKGKEIWNHRCTQMDADRTELLNRKGSQTRDARSAKKR